jgi:hypothetical protein
VAYGTLCPPHGQVSAQGAWKGCSPVVPYAVVPTRVWSPFLCSGIWFVWQAICRRLDRPRPVGVAVSNRPHVRPTIVHLLMWVRFSSRRVSCTFVMEVETAGSSFRLLHAFQTPSMWVWLTLVQETSCLDKRSGICGTTSSGPIPSACNSNWQQPGSRSWFVQKAQPPNWCRIPVPSMLIESAGHSCTYTSAS